MEQHTNTLLVLNLGSEMIYVVAQRLYAQNIPSDKATIVLDEIISVLVSPELIADLMRTTNEILSHKTVRTIIEDVSHSSIMRMDVSSKQKLWDLITMVFKWQVNFSSDIIKLTHRHLYEIETYAIKEKTHLQLQNVQKLVEDFENLLNENDRNKIREDVLTWLSPCHVRVSLFLKLGLQKPDGCFIANNESQNAMRMLKNIGENIYSLGIDEHESNDQRNRTNSVVEKDYDPKELNMFVNQILGDDVEDENVHGKSCLTLNIKDTSKNIANETSHTFDAIDVHVERNKNLDFLDTFDPDEEVLKESSFKDKLLEIIVNDNDEV